jgi:primosomal protein N' (replication factor Y) (superfamily II helicase)
MKPRIISVALDVPLTKNFDFLWPFDWQPPTDADIGRLVVVPFGTQTLVGLVTAVNQTSDVAVDKLRAIASINIDIPALSHDVISLIRFCETYYHAPFGQIAINVIPPALRSPTRTLKPRSVYEHTTAPRVIAAGPHLNDEQQYAVTTIDNAHAAFAVFLLEGITGSGKTEVYLSAIAATLARGDQALVLVPEINLTPAFLKHVAARFPNHRIAPAHSGMAAMARLKAWRDAQAGEADIVVGTRLSVFTPMPRLRLIVVDEEHDQSFKQQEGVRYSARDVAVFRASELKCPIVLGSATPAIETLDNAARGRFVHLKLSQRAVANAQLPSVKFIHLDSEKAPDGLTATLIDAIKVTIANGEQAMVFINRRGYAPALVCGSCGWMPECKRCSARMVFHRAIKKLKCHHCAAERRAPTVCDDCGSTDLHPAGQGSERIEDALHEALPGVRIARVDRDATRRKGSAEKIFADTAKGEVDILVGTQMLAKGHDFPKLTLVGVVNADGAVFSADFRAAERMAQQLMQVSGRAGRAALPGRVLIQTRFPEHPVYQAVASHQYAQFVTAALAERRVMHLPPYSYLALLRVEAKDVAKLDLFCENAQRLASVNADKFNVRVWEPVASTLARKAGYSRKQLMVQSDKRSRLQLFLAVWIAAIRQSDARQIKWVIDVDPIEV